MTARPQPHLTHPRIPSRAPLQKHTRKKDILTDEPSHPPVIPSNFFHSPTFSVKPISNSRDLKLPLVRSNHKCLFLVPILLDVTSSAPFSVLFVSSFCIPPLVNGNGRTRLLTLTLREEVRWLQYQCAVSYTKHDLLPIYYTL